MSPIVIVLEAQKGLAKLNGVEAFSVTRPVEVLLTCHVHE